MKRLFWERLAWLWVLCIPLAVAGGIGYGGQAYNPQSVAITGGTIGGTSVAGVAAAGAASPYNPSNVTITGGTIAGTSVTLPGTPGTTTPGSGIVGEQLSYSTNTSTSGVWLSTALTIPAGHWLVQVDDYFQATNASTTITLSEAGIATSSGTPPLLTALTRQDEGGTTVSTSYYIDTQNIKIMAFTTPTTLYGACITTWAVSTATASCYITATRIF